MATITISYDGHNKTARSIVEMLRSLDFFHVVDQPKEEEEEQEWTAAEEREAFLCTSRNNMSHWLEKNEC